ncbi:hypothetical protein Plhal304r1_c032g0103301 [Plasmopara halstedii]
MPRFMVLQNQQYRLKYPTRVEQSHGKAPLITFSKITSELDYSSSWNISRESEVLLGPNWYG